MNFPFHLNQGRISYQFPFAILALHRKIKHTECCQAMTAYYLLAYPVSLRDFFAASQPLNPVQSEEDIELDQGDGNLIDQHNTKVRYSRQSPA